MPAYVISEVTILDEERADDYRALAASSIALYHGRTSPAACVPTPSRASGPPTPA